VSMKRYFEPLSPNLDLLDGGGTEGVTGGQDGDLAATLDQVRQLGGRGRLTRAVDTDDRDDCQATRGRFEVPIISRKRAGNFFLGDRENIQAGAALGFVSFLDRIDDLAGGGHAEVGADQGHLQILQRSPVQFRRTGHDPFDFVGQPVVGLLKTLLEFREKTHVSPTRWPKTWRNPQLCGGRPPL